MCTEPTQLTTDKLNPLFYFKNIALVKIIYKAKSKAHEEFKCKHFYNLMLKWRTCRNGRGMGL